MNNRLKKTIRAQSAMEYLMTYGWAILIIAVVLGALFSLGVFSSGALLGTACVAGPGFQCQNPVLLTTGNVAFTFGQSTGATLYNVALGCAATTTGAGLPNIASLTGIVLLDTGSINGGTGGAASSISASGSAVYGNVLKANQLTMVSGQTVSVTGLPCFSSTGAALGTTASLAPIGTSFSGSIWMNYTSSSAGVLALGPINNIPAGNWLTTKIATVTLKVV